MQGGLLKTLGEKPDQTKLNSPQRSLKNEQCTSGTLENEVRQDSRLSPALCPLAKSLTRSWQYFKIPTIYTH